MNNSTTLHIFQFINDHTKGAPQIFNLHDLNSYETRIVDLPLSKAQKDLIYSNYKNYIIPTKATEMNKDLMHLLETKQFKNFPFCKKLLRKHQYRAATIAEIK